MQILIIQTAFIGDVILATPIVEVLHDKFPMSKIDFLVRKENESLLVGHPKIHKVLVWEKSHNKYRNLFRTLLSVRKTRYDLIINCQRFFSTGFLTAFSKADQSIGFRSNPLSWLFTERRTHALEGNHEVDRNLSLVNELTDQKSLPKLYPSPADYNTARNYSKGKYITISPMSVWGTKQFPADKWVDFLDQISFEGTVYLLGGVGDNDGCERILQKSIANNIINLAGVLPILSSAALIEGAVMNYTNDSAPLHLASAMNAPVCSVFCSTVPTFGFGPLSDQSFIVETSERLLCRPCNLHGHHQCPEGHFNCAKTIDVKKMVMILESL